jgi:hypothetical protein
MGPPSALAAAPEELHTEYLRRLFGRLEDQAAASGWGWDAGLSLLIDAVLVRLEARRL